MAVKYKLVQNKISGHECFGKWYARSVKSGEVGMKEIERIIEQNCSLKRSDVRAVLTELVDTIKGKLQEGYTVDLDELGRLSLGVKSEGVYRAADFNVKKHITGVSVNYRPNTHRRVTWVVATRDSSSMALFCFLFSRHVYGRFIKNATCAQTAIGI